MAERTTKTGIAISSVDENYTAPANATPEEATKARLAAAMREGVKREKARSLDTITKTAAIALQPVKDAHKEELDRIARTVGKAQHREGLLHGIILGMVAAVGLAFSTWVILREVVITNVSTQRVAMPGDGVPELVDRERPVTYERNPREPGDAR